jgi:hypothetical protein
VPSHDNRAAGQLVKYGCYPFGVLERGPGLGRLWSDTVARQVEGNGIKAAEDLVEIVVVTAPTV